MLWGTNTPHHIPKYYLENSFKYDKIEKQGEKMGGERSSNTHVFQSSTRRPFQLSPTQDMQVEMINRLTCRDRIKNIALQNNLQEI